MPAKGDKSDPMLAVHFIREAISRLSPLSHNLQLTGLKTICLVVSNARKLGLYACLCINFHNMKTKRPTEKL